MRCQNLPEVYHRARDIIFSDKTEHNVTMSKVISRYLKYIEELYKILEDNIDRINVDQKQLTNSSQVKNINRNEELR